MTKDYYMTDEEVAKWIGVSGTSDWGFQFSQIVPLEWSHNKSVSRCSWCNRRYFEKDCVCEGCGATI